MRLDDIIYYEREEAAERAAKETRIQSILELLEEYGKVPEELKEKIAAQDDKETLKGWLKLAARSESLEDFEAKM